MRRILNTSAFLLFLFACDAGAASRALNIVLPVKGDTIANDMNKAGQVAAVFEDDDGRQHGLYFEKGKLIELGTLGGKESEARRINDKGVIVGSSSKRDGTWRAFLYDRAGGMQELGTLGGSSSHGSAINNSGAVVGSADLANGDWHAFVCQPGEALKDLGTLGGKISYATAINNKGQIVGAAANPEQYRHAFYYDSVRGMVDLGTLGGRASVATSINDKGEVVGSSEMPDRSWHAFSYDGKRMQDLGKLISEGDSYATAINNAGHVVGTVLSEDQRYSFVWRDGKMNLHYSGKGLYLTNAINDAELVIGATRDERGLTAATMLSSAVPFIDRGGANLLSMIVLVLVTAVAAVLYRRRYRGMTLEGFIGMDILAK